MFSFTNTIPKITKFCREKTHLTVHATIPERYFAAPIHGGWSRVGGDYMQTYYCRQRTRHGVLSKKLFRDCGIHSTENTFWNILKYLYIESNTHSYIISTRWHHHRGVTIHQPCLSCSVYGKRPDPLSTQLRAHRSLDRFLRTSSGRRSPRGWTAPWLGWIWGGRNLIMKMVNTSCEDWVIFYVHSTSALPLTHSSDFLFSQR